MIELDRRTLLAAGAGLALGLTTPHASAGLVRGLALAELVQRSRSICVARLLDMSCHWVELGGARRIVTDSALEVLEDVAGERQKRVVVRTYGGRVGGVAQLVHGQARFAWHVANVVFLLAREDRHHVVGHAQGHYPLEETSLPRLFASPDLPEIVRFQESAVRRLVGERLPIARELIQEAKMP